MAKPTVTYFDFPGSRGEELRIALHAAGVDFNDKRVKGPDWPALKPSTPYGSMPLFEIPGKPVLAHSNAILVLIGREHGLHPTDNFEAARHEGLMAYCEDARHHVWPVLAIKDDTKVAAREKLANEYLQTWATNVEKQLGAGPFVAGDKLNVADIKLFIFTRWFTSGSVDHVPKTVFDKHEKLMRLYKAVASHPRVAEWTARFQ